MKFCRFVAKTRMFNQISMVSIECPQSLLPKSLLPCPCINHQPQSLHGLGSCQHHRWVWGQYSTPTSAAQGSYHHAMNIKSHVRITIRHSSPESSCSYLVFFSSPTLTNHCPVCDFYEIYPRFLWKAHRIGRQTARIR